MHRLRGWTKKLDRFRDVDKYVSIYEMTKPTPFVWFMFTDNLEKFTFRRHYSSRDAK